MVEDELEVACLNWLVTVDGRGLCLLWVHPGPGLPGAGAVPPPTLDQNPTIGVEHSLGL